MVKQLTVPVNKCFRCRHEWVQRSAKKPIKCPKCQSPNWDRETVRAKKTQGETVAAAAS